MQVEVRLVDPRLAGWGFPHWGSDGSAGLDLFACPDEPLEVVPGAAALLVSTGLAIRIADPHWCGVIAPRSGFGHRGLVLGNTVGIVDSDYEGLCRVSIWNRNPPGSEPIPIAPGDRIAQMLFVRVERPDFAVVPVFTDPSRRGEGGFGSSGIRPRS